MAQINSTFFSPHAGKLEVNFKGSFYQGTNRDAGFPSGDANILMRAYVGPAGVPGGRIYTPSIDRFAPSVFMRCTYPGGGAVWDVASEVLATQAGGSVAPFGFNNLEIYLVLIKR